MNPQPRESIVARMEALTVATGEVAEINGYRIERPHNGYWSISPEPAEWSRPGWEGHGVYPLGFVAERVDQGVPT